jgi:hypothetical protein
MRRAGGGSAKIWSLVSIGQSLIETPAEIHAFIGQAILLKPAYTRQTVVFCIFVAFFAE